MTRAWVNFRAVKAAVSMEMALTNYGLRLHRLDHAYLRGRCPLPAHTSKSSRESFIVNTDKNAWACHSDSCITARCGRIGGNVLDFISAMESCAIREAALKLQDWFLVHAAPAPLTPAPSRNPAETVNRDSSVSIGRNKPLPFALDWIDCSHTGADQIRCLCIPGYFWGSRRYIATRLVVQVGTPHPKKSVSSVQMRHPIANAAARIGQSSGSRSPNRSRASLSKSP